MTEREYALDVIRSWPDAAREAAYNVLVAHGAPDVLEDRAVRWDGLGPWKRVVVCADADDRPGGAQGGAADPAADTGGVVESVIDATIPDDRRAAVDEVAAEFRVAIEDDGEISVRGPDLKANALTLNVVHAMAADGLSAQDARERRAVQFAELRAGHPPDDADELHFVADAPHGEPTTITPRVQRRPVEGAHRHELGNSS